MEAKVQEDVDSKYGERLVQEGEEKDSSGGSLITKYPFCTIGFLTKRLKVYPVT